MNLAISTTIPVFKSYLYDLDNIHQKKCKSHSLSSQLFHWISHYVGDFVGSSARTVNPKAINLSWNSTRDAVAVTKDNAIHLFDCTARSWFANPLHHSSMNHGIYCITWCPDSFCLLVGVSQGIACWRLCEGTAAEKSSIGVEKMAFGGDLSSFVRLLEHPQQLPIHAISTCPSGRLFATVTNGEKVFYVWDIHTANAAPLYCLDDNYCQSLNWSPSGLNIALTDRDGSVLLCDSYGWRSSEVANLASRVSSFSWINEFEGLFYKPGTTQIYLCNISYPEMQQQQSHGVSTNGSIAAHDEAPSTSVSSIPLILNTHCFLNDDSQILEIFDLITDPTCGQYAAIMLAPIGSTTPLPFVAIYLVSTKPMLALTFLRIITAPVDNSTSDRVDTSSYPVSAALNSQPDRDSDWVIIGKSTRGTAISATSIAIAWSDGLFTVHNIC